MFKILFSLFFLNLNSNDVVLKAMIDEIERNQKKLYEKDLPKPYFISYTVFDEKVCEISSFFGSITSRSERKNRSAKIDLRIGDTSFDNSNFITNLRDYKPKYFFINVDDNYDAIRWGLWYLTDEAYKEACEVYSKKRAYRQKRDIKESYPEISFSTTVKKDFTVNSKSFDLSCANYEPLMVELSSLLKKHPKIKSADFNLVFKNSIIRYANSKNNYFKRPSNSIVLTMDIEIQDEKGYIKKDKKDFIYISEKDFNENIKKDVELYLNRFSSVFNASEIDYFLGPAVFVDDAAAQFLNYLFVRNISFYPVPETENENYLYYYYDIPKLIERLNKKVFPGFINVYDDPTIESYNTRTLAGSYEIDDEGFIPKRLNLVENGILKNIYSYSRPSKYYSNSNSRGRGDKNMYVYPFSSNVFIESKKKTSDFFEKAISYAKDFNYEEIAIIERLNWELDDKEKGLPLPLVVYLFNVKTGDKRYLTNVEFEAATLRMLRDIEFTSDDEYIYNFFQRGPFYYDSKVLSSIITPSKIFVREIEFIKSHNKPNKKPYIPHPYFLDKAE